MIRRVLATPQRRQVAWFGVLATLAVFVLFLAAYGLGLRPFAGDGDPLSYLRVARDPFGDGSLLAEDGPEQGIAYRFGRILFPFTGWLLAGGNDDLIRWTMPLVSALAYGACAVAAGVLVARSEGHLHGALFVVGVPTLISSSVLVYGDVVGVALLLGTYAAYSSGRMRLAWFLAALAPLAREVLLAGLLPLAVHHLRTRPRSWPLVAATALPVIAWFLWVHWRVGQFPFLDDSVSRREAVGFPLLGAVTAARESESPILAVAALATAALVVATFVIAVRVFLRRPPERLLASAAVLMATVGLFIGPQAYRYSGEAIRVLMPAHVLLVLIAARNPGPSSRMRFGSPEATPAQV